MKLQYILSVAVLCGLLSSNIFAAEEMVQKHEHKHKHEHDHKHHHEVHHYHHHAAPM